MPRKLFIAVVLFVFIAVFAFPYDGTAVGGYDGSISRYNFIQQASNIDLARNTIKGFGNNIKINKLFQITENDVDEEDVDFLNNQVAFILRNFNVNNGDAFSYAVKRGNANNGWDGWVVFSHYSSSQGWLHYLYYFSIQ
jgi:hypothetical protein